MAATIRYCISARSQKADRNKKDIDAWKDFTDEEYLNDLLGQIWRNSAILTQKFHHMKWAFYSLALAIVPWIISLVVLTFRAVAQ